MIRPSRRQLLALLSTLPTLSCNLQHKAAAAPRTPSLDAAFLRLEGSGRLGAAFLDTETGETYGYKLDERFTMCSTFKLPLAAMILRAVDRGQLKLDTLVPYSKADVVPHMPVTEAHLNEGGMRVEALARAAQVQSDNLAANLLLKELGGPEGLTAFYRELGDSVTRSDRYEPMLNLITPGDARDTTSPRAMVHLVQALLGAGLLTPPSLQRLQGWMLETQTGAKRLRAGLPKSWIVGDKTGTQLGEGFPVSAYNDVACVWFPDRKPLLIAAYYVTPHERTRMEDADQLVLARVGTLAQHWLKVRAQQ